MAPDARLRVALVVLLAAAGAFPAAPARAEPYLALRDGYLCSQCHVNRTGGGKRNAFGTAYAQTVMPRWKRWWGDDSAAGGWFVNPRAGDYVSFGADLRVQNVTAFAASTYYAGQKLTLPDSNTFRIAESNLYAELTLMKDHLSVYLDETMGPDGASAREAFVLLYGLPLHGYLKAGRFLYPAGLRLPDDTIFVREITGFNYANQDLGVEVGAELGPVFANVAATNGTQGGIDFNTKKQVTGTAGVWSRHARLAFHYSWNNGSTNDGGLTRRVVGCWAGGGLGRLVLLAEADVIRDWQGPPAGKTEPAATARWQWALYVEGDVLVTRGVNLRLAYDYHDPDLDVAEDQRMRVTAALEAAVLPFLKLGVFYYLRRDIPQKIQGNQDILIVQLHGFL